MGLYFTRKGDQGESIVAQKKIDKGSHEIETVGELDELNSLIGVLKVNAPTDEFREIFAGIQESLFIIQANCAEFMFHDENGKPKYPAPEFKAGKVWEIEKIIEKYEEEVSPGKGFIVAGSNKGSAWMDFARAVARRAERAVVKFNKLHPLTPEILSYMNRLSSLLFAMARVNAKRGNTEESHPSYK